jgi:hypothetical protein
VAGITVGRLEREDYRRQARREDLRGTISHSGGIALTKGATSVYRRR